MSDTPKPKNTFEYFLEREFVWHPESFSLSRTIGVFIICVKVYPGSLHLNSWTLNGVLLPNAVMPRTVEDLDYWIKRLKEEMRIRGDAS